MPLNGPVLDPFAGMGPALGDARPTRRTCGAAVAQPSGTDRPLSEDARRIPADAVVAFSGRRVVGAALSTDPGPRPSSKRRLGVFGRRTGSLGGCGALRPEPALGGALLWRGDNGVTCEAAFESKA
jgi:hypothetical protein